MAARRFMFHVGCMLVVGVVVFLAVRGGALQATVDAGAQVGPPVLALSLAITLLSMVISGMVWTRLLRLLGCNAGFRVGLAVYASSGLAAYIGSGLGAAGECVLFLRRHGVSAGRSVFLLALASLIGFCGSILWAPYGIVLLQSPDAAGSLPALGTRGPLIVIVATLVCGVGAFVILVLLALTPRLCARLRFRRAATVPGGQHVRLSLHRLLATVPISALSWLVGAMPLWLLVRSAAPASTLSLPEALGIQSVATVIGTAIFFLPNGLGARDGAIVGLLVGVAGVPLPAAAAAAALLRASDPLAKGLIVLMVAVSSRAAPSGRTRRAPRALRERRVVWAGRAPVLPIPEFAAQPVRP